MELGMFLDIGLLLLLLVTIGYCAAVHRRLQALRAAQGEIRQVVEGFADATARAEHSVSQMTTTSDNTVKRLTGKIETARTMATDLDLMISRARKLSSMAELQKPATMARPRAASVAKRKPPAADPARSRAERDLIAALKTAR